MGLTRERDALLAPATDSLRSGSTARRFAKAAQHFIPRGAERLPDAANHVDSRIGRPGLDPLHVTPINLRQTRQIVLRQSAQRSQTVNVFPENRARRQTHSSNVRHGSVVWSGLIVAFLRLRFRTLEE